VDVQFTAGTQNGDPGVSAASHVMEGCKGVLDHAPIPRQQTEDDTAGDQRTNGEDATRTSAQLTELIQTGPGGLSVVSRVVVELSSVTDHATIHRL